jgi:hypothetical protein
MKLKLNVLLAITDALRVKFKNMVADHTKFYGKAQGSFKGTKATYVAKEGMLDDPSKKAFVRVVTTVDEKLAYFIKESGEFINALFSQEKTNASGVATAELVVDGKSWGAYTSLELLRLKSLIESGELGSIEGMLALIPVRSDAEVWNKSTNPEYTGREIWESPMLSGVSKTSVKEEYILADPNISKVSGAYTPKTSLKTITQEVGDYTVQEFSGEWSHRERAGALKRRSDLLIAVTKALKESNECEVVESNLTAERIFGYILKG